MWIVVKWRWSNLIFEQCNQFPKLNERIGLSNGRFFGIYRLGTRWFLFLGNWECCKYMWIVIKWRWSHLIFEQCKWFAKFIEIIRHSNGRFFGISIFGRRGFQLLGNGKFRVEYGRNLLRNVIYHIEFLHRSPLWVMVSNAPGFIIEIWHGV